MVSKKLRVQRTIFELISLFQKGSVKLGPDEEILLFELIPELETLSASTEPNIQQLAALLHGKITSRDSSWASSQYQPSLSEPGQDPRETIKSILRDLNDPLLPVRAHGLIELRKLVLSRDPIAQNNLEKILNIFKTQIAEEDS